MYKIAVVGDKDSILCFKALGVDVFTATRASQSRKIIDNIAKEGYGVIFITEEFAKEIPETLERYKQKITPAIILIPSNKGSLNIGMDEINKNVEKAVGANILN